MRAKFVFIFFSFFLIGTVASGAVMAETKDLAPLIYEGLKFKGNTGYLHDQQKAEMKNTLPEKQFDIDFDGSSQLPDRSDTSFLFGDSDREGKSTVAAMASEMDLFKEQEMGRNTFINDQPELNTEQSSAGSVGRTLIYIGIILAGLLVLFVFLLPRLMHQSVPQNRK